MAPAGHPVCDRLVSGPGQPRMQDSGQRLVRNRPPSYTPRPVRPTPLAAASPTAAAAPGCLSEARLTIHALLL